MKTPELLSEIEALKQRIKMLEGLRKQADDLITRYRKDPLQPRIGFTVAVESAMFNKQKTYTVVAETAGDAVQIAFAADGGWKPGCLDCTRLASLAAEYARVTSTLLLPNHD